MEARRHQEARRQPKIPVQDRWWPHEPGDQDLRHRSNLYPYQTTISDSFQSYSPPRESISVYLDPRETDPRETDSRDPVEPVHHISSGRNRRAPIQFKFYKQYSYTMVKGGVLQNYP